VHLRRCVDIVEFWREQREYLATIKTSLGPKPSHVTDETFATLTNCIFGMIVLVEDVNAGGDKIFVKFCTTDRVENWFAFLRCHGNERSPTVAQAKSADAGGCGTKARRKLHLRVGSLKCSEGTDDAVPRQPEQSCAAPFNVEFMSFKAMARPLPAEFNPDGKWPTKDKIPYHKASSAPLSADCAGAFRLEETVRVAVVNHIIAVESADTLGLLDAFAHAHTLEP
jgi:hypothetical protein